VIKLTKDEEAEFEKMACEIEDKVAAIKLLFGPEARNFLILCGAMSLLNRDYPVIGSKTPEEARDRIKEWIAVGMPEAFTGKWMAQKLLEREMRERRE
jgi:hypothetical protein